MDLEEQASTHPTAKEQASTDPTVEVPVQPLQQRERSGRRECLQA